MNDTSHTSSHDVTSTAAVSASAAEKAVHGKKPRGFATMTPERIREIASAGGKAAHAQGKAHRWTVDQAREAGRKGGQAPHGSRGRQPRSTAT